MYGTVITSSCPFWSVRSGRRCEMRDVRARRGKSHGLVIHNLKRAAVGRTRSRESDNTVIIAPNHGNFARGWDSTTPWLFTLSSSLFFVLHTTERPTVVTIYTCVCYVSYLRKFHHMNTHIWLSSCSSYLLYSDALFSFRYKVISFDDVWIWSSNIVTALMVS